MTLEQNITVKYNRLRQLKQYKEYPDDELLVMAKNLAMQDDAEDLFKDTLANKKEVKLAKRLYVQYLNDYTFDTESDKKFLVRLIHLEVIQNRLEAELNEVYKKSGATNLKTVEMLQQNLSSIAETKVSLGLLRRKNEKDDAAQAFDLLKKKFKTWRQENQASRTLACPHCSKMIFLKMRTTAWEAQPHPFFKDRILGNVHLIKLFQEKKITQEDVGKILGTSPDYVEWLIKRWFPTEDKPAPEPVEDTPSGT